MGNGKLGICVIGTGRAGMIHARNYASGIRGARLVALVDPVAEALAAACKELEVASGFPDYDSAIASRDVDAVVVVAPTVSHREIVVAAARAGKHVFCEKPMAMDVAECDEMIAACGAAKVRLQIGFMRRFDRGLREVKRRIEAGEIGDVVLVKSMTRGPSVPQPWMLDLRKSNGVLAEVNSHDIDTLRWLAASDVVEVSAIAGNYRCLGARAEFPDFYDTFAMTARFRTGALGCIDGAASVGYGYDTRVEVLGTDGVIRAGDIADGTVVTSGRGRGVVRPAVSSWRGLFEQAYRAEAEAFVRSVLEGTEPEVTGHDGRMAVAVVNAGNRSIAEKRPVAVEGAQP
jgi:predicted dehydrogenase